MTNPIATALESIFKYQTCQRCEDVVLSAVNEIERLTRQRDEAQEIAKKYEDRYFGALVERDHSPPVSSPFIENKKETP